MNGVVSIMVVMFCPMMWVLYGMKRDKGNSILC